MILATAGLGLTGSISTTTKNSRPSTPITMSTCRSNDSSRFRTVCFTRSAIPPTGLLALWLGRCVPPPPAGAREPRSAYRQKADFHPV